ncbi:helix-turn-helix domain-containing protein [Phytomonospora endophytica]|uniref:DNA-binding transcriptional MerR regulator n=1 Tax=Phytomonospora endophytica TaxID=714109 RepID=A0A841FHP5_9ACTN|nr:MerR family transcriptional regulator [Phytomonospora endophytica]MBB6035736.1 DNA-binding transcriptional MerR regulator [Phytomonospora endophytica]GIG69586.1 MerR family transcriptional regulator [Phytomonospora endophytica]
MSDTDRNPLYTIGELARRAGVPVRTVRFWSDEGVLPPTTRSRGGYRLYDAAAVARLELVRTLRELGLDLPVVREVVAGRTTLAQVAAAHVNALDTEIRVLKTRRAVLSTVAHRDTTIEEMRLMHKLARLSAAERQRLIDDFVAETFAGVDDDAPGARIATSMRALPTDLPDEPTPAQVDAWVELAELIGDEDFRMRTRQMAVTGAMGGPAEPVPFEPAQVVEKAGAAIAAGIEPGSPEGAALLDELLDGDLDADSRVRLADSLATFTSHKVERYWELLGRLNGWPPFKPTVPAFEWVIAALRG